jgi:hypothetical protein
MAVVRQAFHEIHQPIFDAAMMRDIRDPAIPFLAARQAAEQKQKARFKKR